MQLTQEQREELHYFNLPDNERDQASRLVEDYRKRQPAPPSKDFYVVNDICGRVAGIGSMGRFRYAVLVEGKGSKEARNVILEFKESRPSAYDMHRQRETTPAALAVRAERVIAVQRQSQVASSSHLGFAIDGSTSFQVREIGPHDCRMDVKTLKNGHKLEHLAQIQATILARMHTRAIARAVNLANPLSSLTDTDSFCQRVLAFVLAYADLVKRDWTKFVGAKAELEDCEHWK